MPPRTVQRPGQSSQASRTAKPMPTSHSTRPQAQKRPAGLPSHMLPSKVMTFAKKDDDFDLNELNFAPPPKISKPPARIRAMKKQGPKIPEQGNIEARVQCAYCKRRFAPDRIDKHQTVCGRASKRRPKFDSKRQRLQGSEAEYFARYASKMSFSASPRKGEVPRYKIEHENLVSAIRAAKAMEAKPVSRKPGVKSMKQADTYTSHIKSTMPDERRLCRYCGRRFGTESYERHVNFCASKAPLPRGRFSLAKGRGK